MSDSSSEDAEHSSEEENDEEEDDSSGESDSEEQSGDEKGSEEESSDGDSDEDSEEDQSTKSDKDTDSDDGSESEDSESEEDKKSSSQGIKITEDNRQGKVIIEQNKHIDIESKETQTEPEVTRPEVTSAESQTEEVAGPLSDYRDEKRREYKDESCETEKPTINDREAQTDEEHQISKDTLEEKDDSLLGRENIQQSRSIPLVSSSRPELKDTGVITDVQIDVEEEEGRILSPKPDQRDATTRTEEISTSHKEMQTVEITLVSREYTQVGSTETTGVRVPLKINEDVLLTMSEEKGKLDQEVQADISLKSRRVGTQTKLKHYHVQTLTSGLIKRVNMQTYTSGLISKSEKSASTVNVKMKNRKTQTKEKDILETNNGKSGEEAEILNQNSRKNRVSRSREVSASKESKTAAQHTGAGDSKPVTVNTEEQTEGVNKSRESNILETVLDLEGKPDIKKKKDKENLHKRKRRKREVYFWPIRHPSADSRPKSPKQKQPRARPKSSAPPKSKSAERVDNRPLSAAQYRMLYHHRWAELPF
ncbi:uncharacterized protein LOC133174767 [Saccostrea echinata]|uniref:uncharacterized protein LOC133174767 n=1 Tax=Saccostrea echinata TaxID=191078 RepID=UPI002A81F48E|nr:uncharacterized protein LOC133174767 [Saccostrea echinata]